MLEANVSATTFVCVVHTIVTFIQNVSYDVHIACLYHDSYQEVEVVVALEVKPVTIDPDELYKSTNLFKMVSPIVL